MADEAVVRIVLDATSAPASATGFNAPAPVPLPSNPFNGPMGGFGPNPTQPPGPPPSPFQWPSGGDFLGKGAGAAQTHGMGMMGGWGSNPTQPPGSAFDPHPKFDPVEIAKKRVKAEEERRLVDEEYKKLKPPEPPLPPPPFDPVKLAKERVKAEEQRHLVDAEYKKLKPQGALDSFVQVSESFRGILGGTFGKVVGAVLDVTAQLRKLRGNTATGATTSQVPTGGGTTPTATAAGGKKPILGAAFTGGTGATTGAAEGAEVSTAATGATGAMAKMVPVIGAVVAAAAAVVVAFNAISAAADKAVERYGDYSQEVARAQAVAEINKVTNDIRRASEYGNQLADYVKAKAEMEEKWEEIKMALMSKLIPVVTGIMNALGGLLGIASKPTNEDVKDPGFYLFNQKVLTPEE